MSDNYQVLIVDDEIDAVRGIKASVDWLKLNVSEIYSSYNIRQAKETIGNKSIDIMICDIEMPQGSGIELLEWAKEEYPELVSIFLTCHAEFQYAQKALQLGALNYLLKPVNSKDLEDALQKAQEIIQSRKQLTQKAESYNRYYQLWSMNKPHLTEHFWLNLLDGTIPSDQESIDKALLDFDIPKEEDTQYLPIILTVLHMEKSMDLKKTEYMLKEKAQLLISREKRKGLVLAIKKSVLLILIQVPRKQEINRQRLISICTEYIEQGTSNVDCDISCYIGGKARLNKIAGIVNDLIQMSISHIASRKRIFFIDEQYSTKLTLIPAMDKWVDLFVQGEMDEIYSSIKVFFETLSKLDGLHIEVLNDFYRRFIQIIYTVLQKKVIQENQLFISEELDRGMAATRTLSEFISWVYSIVDKLTDYISKKPYSIVERVKDYIINNIGNNLSRKEIADHVHINQDYLSRLFKKETGMSISNYITSEKIKIAKELLINTEIQISEIAGHLGYANFSHFSKTFKKETGQKPLEYRHKKDI